LQSPARLDDGEPGRAQWISETPGRLEIATRSTGRRLLFVSESFHRGWRCSIDAQPSEVLPVYGDFLGCVVPEGRHVVRFEFAPWSVRLGRWLSALGLALIACWALAMGRSLDFRGSMR
jgi:uncharacterized membrane protein YfhO